MNRWLMRKVHAWLERQLQPSEEQVRSATKLETDFVVLLPSGLDHHVVMSPADTLTLTFPVMADEGGSFTGRVSCRVPKTTTIGPRTTLGLRFTGEPLLLEKLYEGGLQ